MDTLVMSLLTDSTKSVMNAPTTSIQSEVTSKTLKIPMLPPWSSKSNPSRTSSFCKTSKPTVTWRSNSSTSLMPPEMLDLRLNHRNSDSVATLPRSTNSSQRRLSGTTKKSSPRTQPRTAEPIEVLLRNTKINSRLSSKNSSKWPTNSDLEFKVQSRSTLKHSAERLRAFKVSSKNFQLSQNGQLTWETQLLAEVK